MNEESDNLKKQAINQFRRAKWWCWIEWICLTVGLVIMFGLPKLGDSIAHLLDILAPVSLVSILAGFAFALPAIVFSIGALLSSTERQDGYGKAVILVMLAMFPMLFAMWLTTHCVFHAG